MTRYVGAALAVLGAITMPFSLPATAAVAGKAKARPNLRVVAVTSPARAPAGGVLVVKSKLSNKGPGVAGASRSFFYLSTDARLQTRDLLVNFRRVPALKAGRAVTTNTRLPVRVRAGTWYVIVCADAFRKVAETNERDNCRASSSITLTEQEGPIRLVRNDEAVRQRLRAAGNLLYEYAAVEGSDASYERIWIMADSSFRYEWSTVDGGIPSCRYAGVGTWALAEGYIWAENGGGFAAVLIFRPSDGNAPQRHVLRFPNAEPDTMYDGDRKFQRKTSMPPNC